MLSRRARVVLIMLFALLFLIFLWRVRSVLTPFLLASVLVYALNPAVEVLQRRFPRALAVSLVFVGITLFMWGGWLLLGPSLLHELREISARLPSGMDRMETWLLSSQKAMAQSALPSGVKATLEKTMQSLQHRIAGAVDESFLGLGSLFRFFLDAVLAPFLAFYLLLVQHRLKDQLLAQVPPTIRNEADLYLTELDRVAAGFIRGQLLLSLVIGLITIASLAIIGIPYAVLLGLLAGIFEVVPFVGPVMAWLPAFLLAGFEGPGKVIAVLVAFIIIHQVDAAVLAPRIMANSIGLHPLVVVFSLLAGGELMGLAGVLLALPIAAMIKVTLIFFYRLLVRFPPTKT